MSQGRRRARVVAHANIALAKYWGKARVEENLPAVPSLSLTLDGLRTHTTVEYDAALEADVAILDGRPLSGRPLARISSLLEQVRRLAGGGAHARVRSQNDFPTAAGLASSASGFAALALAATRAAGLELPPGEVSALARSASASAARSVFGGFVALEAGAEQAQPVAPPEYWSVSMLLALVASGPKSVGSTVGMLRTADSSPYYPTWLQQAPGLFEQSRRAVLERDLRRLGAAMEQSALMMHASMFTSRPPVIYFRPATLAAVERVQELRDAGTTAYFTIDAGPHVKVLTERGSEQQVFEALSELSGVERVLVCHPGPGAHELHDEP